MKELTRAEKNAIHHVISVNQLDPARFEFRLVKSRFNTVIGQYGESYDNAWAIVAKENNQCFFTFEDSRRFAFSGSAWPELNGQQGYTTNTWQAVLTDFGFWLSLVRYELEEPDLWNTALSQAQGDADERDRRFTKPEIQQITLALDNVKKKLEALPGFDAIRAKKLEAKIDYLVEKAKEQTINEWRVLYVGTVVTIYAEPWLKPFAEQFKDAVTHLVWPLLQNLLSLH